MVCAPRWGGRPTGVERPEGLRDRQLTAGSPRGTCMSGQVACLLPPSTYSRSNALKVSPRRCKMLVCQAPPAALGTQMLQAPHSPHHHCRNAMPILPKKPLSLASCAWTTPACFLRPAFFPLPPPVLHTHQIWPRSQLPRSLHTQQARLTILVFRQESVRVRLSRRASPCTLGVPRPLDLGARTKPVTRQDAEGV